MADEPCKHERTQFLACSAGDRFPGIWYCPDCNDSFSFDPLGRTSVRYLQKPNPKANKEIILSKSTGK